MDEYIIVTTLCNDEEIAKQITLSLLENKLVAGSQVSKVKSIYWWKNKLEESEEYHLEFRTKKHLFDEVKAEIKKIHDYEVAEISAVKIENANPEFLKWIDENVK